jgi:DNA modification methylase
VTPFVQDVDFTLYVGDAVEVLRELPDESVHCCVTSPPYWGLRDYGTGQWDGGDADCDHQRQSDVSRGSSGLDGATTTQGGAYAWKDVCGKCGATRVDQQIGLEATPEAFVESMVAVFREVRRVLRRDGTVWLNLGDSYAGSGKGPSNDGSKQRTNSGSLIPGTRNLGQIAGGQAPTEWLPVPQGIKGKDLVGIPWRVAFALQADGWYLRSDIIWAKPNPMPESVTDRPTKAHEYVFLLTRSPRYFFDQEAVREAYEGDPEYRYGRVGAYQNRAINGLGDGTTPTRIVGPDGRRKTTVKGGEASLQHRDGERWPNGGRNIRSVWEIATQPYAEAHFATFPEALPERCIKAGCPDGGTVLDPFMGSGTTALVARRLGRKSVGIELNPEYAKLCARRLQQLSLFGGQAA